MHSVCFHPEVHGLCTEIAANALLADIFHLPDDLLPVGFHHRFFSRTLITAQQLPHGHLLSGSKIKGSAEGHTVAVGAAGIGIGKLLHRIYRSHQVHIVHRGLIGNAVHQIRLVIHEGFPVLAGVGSLLIPVRNGFCVKIGVHCLQNLIRHSGDGLQHRIFHCHLRIGVIRIHPHSCRQRHRGLCLSCPCLHAGQKHQQQACAYSPDFLLHRPSPFFEAIPFLLRSRSARTGRCQDRSSPRAPLRISSWYPVPPW